MQYDVMVRFQDYGKRTDEQLVTMIDTALHHALARDYHTGRERHIQVQIINVEEAHPSYLKEHP